MADQDYRNSDTNEVDSSNEAYPNRGIDHNSSGDPAKGGVMGAVGGAVVGALAGGPIGAVIGAVAGGAASAAGVAAVDHVDHDNSPNETGTYDSTRDASYDNTNTGTTARFVDSNDTTGYDAANSNYRSPDAVDSTEADYRSGDATDYNSADYRTADSTTPTTVEEDYPTTSRSTFRNDSNIV